MPSRQHEAQGWRILEAEEWSREALATCEPAAFDAVYRANAGELLRLLRRGFGFRGAGGAARSARLGAFDAEEVVQDTFEAFFRQVRTRQFDIDRPVRPYLMRIACNLALKKLGRAGREVSTELESFDTAFVPADAAEAAERTRLVNELRDNLSDRERTVLLHYFEEDESQEAIGVRLGLSRDQVYRSIVRIREVAWSFFKSKGWFDDSR